MYVGSSYFFLFPCHFMFFFVCVLYSGCFLQLCIQLTYSLFTFSLLVVALSLSLFLHIVYLLPTHLQAYVLFNKHVWYRYNLFSKHFICVSIYVSVCHTCAGLHRIRSSDAPKLELWAVVNHWEPNLGLSSENIKPLSYQPPLQSPLISFS